MAVEAGLKAVKLRFAKEGSKETSVLDKSVCI